MQPRISLAPAVGIRGQQLSPGLQGPQILLPRLGELLLELVPRALQPTQHVVDARQTALVQLRKVATAQARRVVPEDRQKEAMTGERSESGSAKTRTEKTTKGHMESRWMNLGLRLRRGYGAYGEAPHSTRDM